MKLELEVLASTSIKRKKPWPRMAFMGQMQESLFLMDRQRLSTLYIPSGKTRKKIPKLHSILGDVVVMNHSDNGVFIGGILKNGDAFIWHKDKDLLKTIPGVPAIAGKIQSKVADDSGRTTYAVPHLTISGDGSKLLVVVNTCEVYIWEKEINQGLLWPKRGAVQGTWSRIMPDHDVALPSADCKECSSSSVFYVRRGTIGRFGLCSFVYNEGNDLCITTLVLRWFDTQDIYSYRRPIYTAEWSSVRFPMTDISSQAMPIRAPGAYVSSYTHDGSLLAVAVNQFDSFQNRMLYFSPWTDTTVATDMKGAGSKTPIIRHARWYWVADMKWTNDDLFLICITKQGAAAIISRLGEPLLIQTHGNSIEMGPKMFLPLHPLIVVQGAADEFAESQSSKDSGYCDDESDPLRQRFSVAVHPSQPIVLCSDGYMVTVLAMPSHTTCLSIMRGLVTEANRHLRLIKDQQKFQMTMFETLKRQKKRQQRQNMKFGRAEQRIGLMKSLDDQTDLPNQYQRYRFENEPDDSLNRTMEGDLDDVDPKGLGAMANIDFNMGKIMFGDVENMNNTLDYSHLFNQEGISLAEHINRCQKGLILAWGIAATHSGRWTVDHEDVANHIVHDMVKLFSVILHSSPEVLKELEVILGQPPPKSKKSKRMRTIMKVFSLYQSMMRMLGMDAIHRHLIACTLSFANSTVDTVVKRKDMPAEDPKMESLHGSYVLLKLSEFMIKKTYSSPPKGVQVNGFPFGKLNPIAETLDSAILSNIRIQPPSSSEDSHDEVSLADSFLQDDDVSQLSAEPTIAPKGHSSVPKMWCQLDPCKRLANSWKTLYKHSTHYYKFLQISLSALKKKTKVTKMLESEFEKVTNLILVIQCKLQSLGVEKSTRRKKRSVPGDKLSIEGSTTLAIHSWIHLLESAQDDETLVGCSGRYLHAIMYTHLMQENPRAAMDLVELLLRQTEIKKAISVCKQNEDSRKAILSLLLKDYQDKTMPKLPNEKKILPPRVITSRAARHTVQSLARIMAGYFTNGSLFVYPPHAPRRIPPLHTEYTIDHRIYPLYHDTMAAVLREKGLGEAWTVERTLEYLLVGGLLPEAVWFVHSLGDWKAAFLMSVALMEHERSTPELYEKKKKLYLPPNLQPQSIIQEQLEVIFKPNDNTSESVIVDESTDFDQLSSSLSDLLLASTICQVDLVPWLLDQLSDRLKTLVRQFTPVVPEGLYLPAPPVYCPQPAPDTEESIPADVKNEIKLRREVSSVIILLQLVLSGSKTTIPAATWYVQKVLEAFAKGLKFKKGHQAKDEIELDIQVLQDTYLGLVSTFQGLEINPSVNKVLTAFRDMCTITWMMYARDKLSIHLRKKATLAEKRMRKIEKVSDMEWLTHCKKTLEWSLHMLPFTHCFEEADEVFYGAVLSLLVELPASEATGKILAEHFYDVDNLHPNVQDRLHTILKEWQRIFLDDHAKLRRQDSSNSDSVIESPRGLTLSLYYQKQVQKVEKLLSRKNRTFGKYDEFVFARHLEMDNAADFEDDGVGCIGSRPMESTEEYLQFLDEFYAVSFHQIMDAERENKGDAPTPLLLEYCDTIRGHELNSLTHRAVSSLQKKQGGFNVVKITSPRGLSSPRGQMVTPLRLKVKKSSPRSLPPNSQRKRGLFRSRSFSDISKIQPKKEPENPKADNLNNSWLGGTLTSDLVPNKTHVLTTSTKSKTSRQLPKIPPYFPRVEGKLERSMSVSDIQKQLIPDDPIEGLEESVDPLTSQVVPEWLLDNMVFDPKWNRTEQLLQWLFRWSNRNHTLVDRKNFHPSSPRGMESSPAPASPMKKSGTSAMKIRVPPRMMMYSLWLMENVYYPDPSYAAQAQIPREAVEVTVAMAGRHGGATSPGPAPPRGLTPPPPDTGRSDFTTISEISEDITISGIEELDRNDRQRSKKDRKKKKEKKRERRQEMPVEPEVRTNAIEKKVTRKLTFKLPDPEPDTESRQSSARSDSTINVSSLDEDSREFVAEVVRRNLEMSNGSMDGFTSPSSKEGTLDSTVRFVGPAGRGAGQAPLQRGQEPVLNSDIGQQVASIVREELKKMMQAQHQSIVAAMGSLEPGNQGNNGAPIQPQQSQATSSRIPARAEPEKKTDCVVMTVQADVAPDLKSYSSDIDVSPLNSDDLFSDGSKSTNGKPMTVEELDREHYRHSQRHGQPLNGALQEMRSLENRYTGMPPPSLHSQPGYFNTREDNKENAHSQMQQPPLLQSPYSASPSQPHEPFSRLMGILRQVNHDLGAPPSGGPGPMSLLQMNQGGHQGHPPPGVFPPIHAWTDTRQPHPQQQPSGAQHSSMPYMPQSQTGQYNEPPQRDWGSRLPSDNRGQPNQTGQQEIGSQIPLLRLPTETKFENLEENKGVKLIPPELIIEYEQKKYLGKNAAQKQLDDYMKKQSQHKKQPPHPGLKLLKVDMEPFGPPDERDNERRHRRRLQKQSETPRKAKHLSLVQSGEISPRSEDRTSQMASDVDEDSIEGSMPATVIRVSPRKKESPRKDSRRNTPRKQTPRKGSPRRDSPRKTPRSARSERVEEEEVPRLASGYALTPGMFDEYLDKDGEHGTALDNNARAQYRAAKGVQPKKHVLRKDVACDTEQDLNMIDAATAIAREQGTDPVSEALAKYYRAKTGHSAGILPPDIFLGLRFNDMNKDQTVDPNAGAEGPANNSGRAFLSVVDIGSDMLEDIPSTLPEDQRKKTLKDRKSPSKPRSSRSRVEFQEPEKEEDAFEELGPDRLTVNLLDNAGSSAGFRVPDEDILAQRPGDRRKESIRQRLGDMNHQFNAINTMAQNIEADLKSTNMLMRTIEQIGEAIQPTQDISREDEEPIPEEEKGDQREDDEPESDIFQNKHNLRPSEVKRYGRQDRRAERRQDRVSFDDELDDDQVRDSYDREDRDRLGASDSRLEISGVSGISDILGEVIATGDVDIKQLGFTQKESDALVERAIKSARSSGRLSHDELHKILHEAKKQKKDDQQKKQVQEWMEKKRRERSEDYKKRQSELREAERQPYQSPAKDTDDMNATKTIDVTKARSMREKRAQDNIEKRKKQASQLMGTILADQVNQPKAEPTWAWDEVPVGGKKRDTSPGTRPSAARPKSSGGRGTRKTTTAPRARFVSPSPVRGERGYDEDRMRVEPDRYLSMRDSHDRRDQLQQQQPRGRMRASGSGRMERSGTSEFAGTMRTSDGLRAYTKHLENMDTGDWQDVTPRPSTAPTPRPRPRPAPQQQLEQPPQPEARPYKPKPFNKMVRLQRPEVTRGRQARPQPQPYVDRLSMLSSAGNTGRTESGRREQERLYGTKRLPGSYKNAERKAPRVVKTYQERLADMKSSRPPTQPMRRTYGVRSSQEMIPAGPPRRTAPRKTLTYAEQLQQLQPPKEQYRSGEGAIAPGATFKRAHGPAHKPKTYAEQLQELQKPVAPRPSRQRPYASPYADPRVEDDSGAMSPWSLDHDIHNMIYDGEENSYHPSAAATDFDISELTELDYLPEYTDMVGIEDLEGLEQIESVSEAGSIMSFIDWDAVENLIADIQ